MTAISKLHATSSHLDTHFTFAAFIGGERFEVEKESDFIYFIAKLKAFEYLRRRSKRQSFCYEDFVNAEMKFYKEELEFHSRKGAKDGKCYEAIVHAVETIEAAKAEAKGESNGSK